MATSSGREVKADESRLAAEIETLSAEIDGAAHGNLRALLNLKKQRGDKMLELAEIQELARVEEIQREAVESGMVTTPFLLADAEEKDCPLCFEPIPNPKHFGDDHQYDWFSCCDKCICVPCVAQWRKTGMVDDKCPFCRAPTPGPDEKDSAEQVQRERSNAKAGRKRAQFELAARLELGEGVDRNMAEAMWWYHLAADQGHVTAQQVLGYHYSCGCSEAGITESPEKAIEKFTAAASQGCAKSQAYLGLCCDKSNPDYLKWLYLSAAQGYAVAEGNLGSAHWIGNCGLEKSLARALFWMKRAAVRGHDVAQSQLATLLIKWAGELYGSSQIVGFSPYAESCFWLRMAAASGHEEAILCAEAREKRIAKLCGVCGKTSSNNDAKLLKCTKCKSVAYCGRDCQRKHWKIGHKTDCYSPESDTGS